MNRWRNSLYASGAIALVAVAFAGSGTGQIIAQAISQVKVVNTLREPVPTIATGTTQVSVSNSPTVQIGNGDTHPVPVKPVSVVRQPFQASANGAFVGGSVSGSAFIAVPAGKRLFIEYATAFIVVPTGQNVHQLSLATTIGGAAVPHQLTRNFAGPHFSGTDDVFSAGQETHLYADGGTSVAFSIARNSSVGTGTISVSLSGYLEDMP
ncbi:MAG: hypothetical protein ABI882_20405 [Acidobacteriota bacterium]